SSATMPNCSAGETCAIAKTINALLALESTWSAVVATAIERPRGPPCVVGVSAPAMSPPFPRTAGSGEQPPRVGAHDAFQSSVDRSRVERASVVRRGEVEFGPDPVDRQRDLIGVAHRCLADKMMPVRRRCP